MIASDLNKKLTDLNPEQAKRCLVIILRQFEEENQVFATLIKSQDMLETFLRDTAYEQNISIGPLKKLSDEQQGKIIIDILLILAERDDTRARLNGALDAASRNTRLELITTSAVLAGLVFLLSTEFNLDYENSNGEKNLRIKISKKSTSTNILSKFFNLLKQFN